MVKTARLLITLCSKHLLLFAFLGHARLHLLEPRLMATNLTSVSFIHMVFQAKFDV